MSRRYSNRVPNAVLSDMQGAILGTFMDATSFMIITLPIIFPAMMSLGFDPIWFGVLMVCQSEIALVTPPFALNIFVIRGVVPDTTIAEITAGVFPFLFAMVAILIIYIVFPQLSLWLPSMMS